MRSFAGAVLGAGIVAVAFLLVQGQPGLAQQPPSYADISQNDFERIDSIVRKIFKPLTKGDIEGFKKVFSRHCSPALQCTDAIAGTMKLKEDALGRTRAVKYVRHDSISNVTDYYVFYYADLRETTLSCWQFDFYKTKGEWNILGYRTEGQSPVEFFKLSELQYNSLKK